MKEACNCARAHKHYVRTQVLLSVRNRLCKYLKVKMIRPIVINIQQPSAAKTSLNSTQASAAKCASHSELESNKTHSLAGSTSSPSKSNTKISHPLYAPNVMQSHITNSFAQRKNIALQAQVNNEKLLDTSPLSNLINQVAPQTGIVKAHLEKLQQLALEKNCVIAIRPVDEMATQLIELGHPTKGFHIKGKSASWGPQAGLICVDQSLSKLAGTTDEAQKKISKFTAQVKDCMRDRGRGKSPYAVKVPLLLSQERLKELIAKEIISYDEGKGKITAQKPGDKDYTFDVTQKGESYAITYEKIKGNHGNDKTVYVLAPHEGSLPFTADYDLLFIAPSFEQFGETDKPPITMFSYNQFKQKTHSLPLSNQKTELLKLYPNADHFYAKENPEIGNASPRIKEIIGDINKKLGCHEGKEVVHHNADSSSPASDYSTNYPATIFLPKAIGEFKEINIINNDTELAKIIQTLKDNNFYVPINPLWEEKLLPIKSRKFSETMNAWKIYEQKSEPSSGNL